MWLQKHLTSKDTPIAQANLEEVVQCNTCGCLIQKSWAQEVTLESYGTLLNYCISHRKPYNRVCGYSGDNQEYFGEVKMTKDGKPI